MSGYSSSSVNAPIVAPYQAGRYIEPFGASSGNAAGIPVEGKISCFPIYLPGNRTIDTLATWNTVAGSAGAVVRFGVWDDLNGMPNNLQIDAGTVAAVTGNQLIPVTTSWTVPSTGWYWLGTCVQGAAVTRPTLVNMVGTTMRTQLVDIGGPNGFGGGGWYQNGNAGAFPATIGAVLRIGISAVPIVYCRWV